MQELNQTNLKYSFKTFSIYTLKKSFTVILRIFVRVHEYMPLIKTITLSISTKVITIINRSSTTPSRTTTPRGSVTLRLNSMERQIVLQKSQAASRMKARIQLYFLQHIQLKLVKRKLPRLKKITWRYSLKVVILPFLQSPKHS